MQDDVQQSGASAEPVRPVVKQHATAEVPFNRLTPTDDEVTRALRHQWFPVARVSDLKMGPHATMLLGVPLVAFRGENGHVAVLHDACPHRGAALSMGRVVGDAIECPYHGWQWQGSDGSCTLIPSLRDGQRIPPRAVTRALPAREHLGLVWTALEEPLTDLWDPPELQTPGLVFGPGEPVRTSAGMRTTVENFRDVSHFPFVHRETMGELAHVVDPLDVRREERDIYMEVSYQRQQGGDPTVKHDMTLSYHVTMPGLSTIVLQMEAGTRYVMHVPSPVNDAFTDIYWLAGFLEGYTLFSLDEVLQYEALILAEDLPVVNGISPREAPLELSAGVSVPADKFTLAYRRTYAEFVRSTNEVLTLRAREHSNPS